MGNKKIKSTYIKTKHKTGLESTSNNVYFRPTLVLICPPCYYLVINAPTKTSISLHVTLFVVRKRLFQSHLTRHGWFLTNHSTVFAGPGQVSLKQPFGVMY